MQKLGQARLNITGLFQVNNSSSNRALCISERVLREDGRDKFQREREKRERARARESRNGNSPNKFFLRISLKKKFYLKFLRQIWINPVLAILVSFNKFIIFYIFQFNKIVFPIALGLFRRPVLQFSGVKQQAVSQQSNCPHHCHACQNRVLENNPAEVQGPLLVRVIGKSLLF